MRDLRDTMIAGIALGHHAALIGCETCRVGVRPCDPGVIRSFLHRPDCSQAGQTVVGRDQRKVHDLSNGGKEPIFGIALWQRELLGDQHDLVGQRCFSAEALWPRSATRTTWRGAEPCPWH